MYVVVRKPGDPQPTRDYRRGWRRLFMAFPASCVDRPRANFLLAGAVRITGTTGARLLALAAVENTKTPRTQRRTKEEKEQEDK